LPCRRGTYATGYRETAQFLGFLKKVDSVLSNPALSPTDWAVELARYVNDTLAREAEKPKARWQKDRGDATSGVDQWKNADV